jgi:hypothetical protein
LRPNVTIWIEITGRRDLGANLNAPQGDKNGNPHWSYRLIHDVRPGERVFHWDTGHQAVVGVSTAVGRPWADNVLWAARGTRSRGIEPHVQPGWYLALEGFTPLATPLTAAEVFERRDEVFAVRDRLRAAQRAALAFPFILYGGTKVQAFQTYLTRFPAELAELFPSLMEALGDVAPATQWPAGGSAYRPANELTAVGDRDPFEVDPAQVERALRGHA